MFIVQKVDFLDKKDLGRTQAFFNIQKNISRRFQKRHQHQLYDHLHEL